MIGGLLGLALTGCAVDPADESRAPSFEVDRAGRYPVAINRGQAPARPLDVCFEIGRVSTDGALSPEDFGRITSVAIAPDGHLFVADAQSMSIRVFDADGRFLHEFGRAGEGPGEFASLYSLGFVGDTLLVLDLRNGRISEHGSDGRHLGTRPVQAGLSGPPTQLRFYTLDSGRVAQWALSTENGATETVWVGHDAAGVVTTWPQIALRTPPGQSVRCDRSDGGISFFTAPFAARLIIAPSRIGAQWLAGSDGYVINEITADGDTLRALRGDRRPQKITDDEWA